jgi:hypothetical protein
MKLRAWNAAAVLLAVVIAAGSEAATADDPPRDQPPAAAAQAAPVAFLDQAPAAVDALEENAPEPESPSLEAPSLEAYWGRRLSHAQQRVALARERAEKAEAAYSRARHDGHPRGAALEEIKAKHSAAEVERLDSEAALPKLVEQARRAGVAPGVLSEYWVEE